MRLLLEWGVEVNQADAYGDTALHVAADLGDEEMASTLLIRGADISRKRYRGQTGFVLVSLGGHVAVVRLLLRSTRAGEADERDAYGLTALWHACFEGHANLVRALLLAGADHIIADNHDTTPLHVAEEEEDHDCIGVIQVSTSLVSRRNGHHDGTVFVLCGAHVVWGRASQSVPVLQWWEPFIFFKVSALGEGHC
jgi:ankyrin repeat protein